MSEQLDFEGIARSPSGRRPANTTPMKTLTVRLPESLFAEIANDAETRKISKSEIVRQRLERATGGSRMSLVDELDDLEAFELMANLLGAGLPGERLSS